MTSQTGLGARKLIVFGVAIRCSLAMRLTNGLFIGTISPLSTGKNEIVNNGLSLAQLSDVTVHRIQLV